ncbi:MAG: hypothetical protein K2V38_09390 [Gemmataceae bacterium]|nr:hypothetical protein [Gemmataceae bacterium]
MTATIVFVLASFAAADDPPGGWPDLFPKLDNFGRKVEAPKVEKGEKPTVYSQSASYEWLGGRFEAYTITLARDPKFKEKYTPEAMKKENPAPEVMEINKKPAYMWDFKKADKLTEVNCRLVVVLADDKVIVIEQRGTGTDVAATAKKIDFDKVLKALDNPPAAKQK